MTSCCEMRASRALTWSSVRRWRSLPSRTGWPGIGIESCTPSASASGKILFSDSAAASAFGLPPSRQSSNWKRDCLTGFENATLPESTKVIFLQPQPWRERERERKRQGEVAASAFTPPFFPLAGKRTHLEDPGDGATQGARPEEETPRARDLLRLEAGEGPPLHQLQVQVHRGRGPLLGVQGGRQVGAPRPKAALQERARGQGGRVALPVSGQMLVGNPCI